MSILVTGASGFVGLNLVEALLERGEHVVTFAPEGVPEAVRDAALGGPGSLDEMTGDVRDDAALERTFRDFGIERVFHAAVITGAYERERNDLRTILEVNILGTAAVLEAARRHGVVRFVYLSSIAVYGESLYAYDEMDEATTPPVPIAAYQITKYTGERLALRFKSLFGMDVVCGRIGSVYGPWERATGVRDTLSPLFQLAAIAAEGGAAVLPAVQPPRNWVYSRDIAGALVALMFAERPRHPVYNLSTEDAWDLTRWCEALKRQFPAFSYRSAGDGEEANVSLHDERPEDRATQSIRRLKEDIGFAPAFSPERGCEDYIAWIARTPNFRDLLA